MRRPFAIAVLGVLMVMSAACSSNGAGEPTGSDVGSVAPSDPVDTATIVGRIAPAVEAVEAELGEGQAYFEVTSTAAGLVNVFVAVDDATAAVPYLYVEGELQPPAPTQEGASGNTFAASDIDFDPATVLDRLESELPETSVEAFSVYGDGFGATYVVAGRSSAGGALDIVLGPDGQIVSVDPI